MTTRQRKRLLLLVNAALALALAAVVVAAFMPLESFNVKPTASGPRLSRSGGGEQAVGPLEAYAGIYQRQLRSRMFDMPAPVVADVRPTAAPPSMHLIGTAIEPGASCGIFRSASGEVSMVSVGESIDGAELVSVNETSATLRVSGRLVTVQCEKAGP